MRPLLEVAIGQPPAGGEARIVVQVPMDVALREPVVVSVDAPGADEATTPKPQTELVTASYFACVPAGCIADAALDAETLENAAKCRLDERDLYRSRRGQKVTVPVAMAGFGDAWAALGLAAP